MKMWIDTEFNSFKGELISMAIVTQDGREFYESLGCFDPDPWVAENVIPVIGKKQIGFIELQDKLYKFLLPYEHMHLIADWPEDIQHFCETLIIGPGLRISTPLLTMEIRRDLDAESEIPHNALSDARAIKAKYMSLVTD